MDLEGPPADPKAELVVDVVIHNTDGLPCDVGADSESSDVAVERGAPFAAERRDDPRGNHGIEPGLLDLTFGCPVRPFELQTRVEPVEATAREQIDLHWPFLGNAVAADER